MGILKIVEWKDESTNTLVHRIDCKKDYINRGSKLIVRESQVAVFADKGRFADCFGPGTYTLDTDNIPIITKLLSWKYGFESPFKSEVYFVNTKVFTNNRWGTMNPILIRDQEFGAIRIKGFGTYAFKVSDAPTLLRELSGTNSSYETKDIIEWIRSSVVTNLTDAIGEAQIPVLDMASNLVEFGETVKTNLNNELKDLGLELTKFNFENFSVPENIQAMLDKQTELGMYRKNMDVYTQMEQLKALNAAAANTGAAGTLMGAGIGLGAGVNLGQAFGNMTQPIAQGTQNQGTQAKEDTVACPHCGAKVKAGAKFCPECGKPTQKTCPKCGAVVGENAKFCPECGASLKPKCPKCGADVAPGAKFCPECGEKLM